MKLVKGYLTPTQKKGWVKHVAVFEDGKIRITRNAHPVHCEYFNRRFVWDSIEVMPQNCEFCGNYPANT
jgi:hypothetical protein